MKIFWKEISKVALFKIVELFAISIRSTSSERTQGSLKRVVANYSVVPTPSAPATSFKQNPGFVYARSGQLYLGENSFNFRGFNAPTLARGSIYEDIDLLKSIAGFPAPVTRCYSLSVEKKYPPPEKDYSTAHVLGWNQKTNDWIYNEPAFLRLDEMLAIAASEGVKIILPLINQDYGSTGSDWVGNFNDLIRHRFQISDYAAAHVTVDWFTNTTIRNDFKKIIKYVLNRKNTKNGRVYGSDDTFLAFETGNELNWASYTPISVNNNSTIINTNNDNSKIRDTSSNKDDGNDNGPEPESDTVNFITYKISHSRPAPSNWTIDIARYIKSLAPRIMVMDGSFARTTVAADAWPQETLLSPYVDLFSYHLYGDGDALIASSYQAQAEKYNKAAVIGEHGFYSSINSWEEFYERFTGAGSLAWSLRPHSPRSGFITHSEGNNIYSYHIPGWSENSNEFDPLEYNIVKLTYNNCYSALGKKLQPYPIPLAPEPFIVSHEDYDGLSFKGSAWARGYEIWAFKSSDIYGIFRYADSRLLHVYLKSRHEDSEFFQVAEEVHDNVLAGELFMEIDPHHPTHLLQLQKKTLTKNTHKISGKWKDLKWATTTTVRDQHNKTYHAYKNYMDYSGNLSPLDGSKISTNCSGTLRKTKFKKRSQKSREAWFIIRGLSIDGVPGPFSSPISV